MFVVTSQKNHPLLTAHTHTHTNTCALEIPYMTVSHVVSTLAERTDELMIQSMGDIMMMMARRLALTRNNNA